MDQPSRLRSWQFLQGICLSTLNLQTSSASGHDCFGVNFLTDLPPFPLQQLSEVIRSREWLNQACVSHYINYGSKLYT